jgi:hypothetical protein
MARTQGATRAKARKQPRARPDPATQAGQMRRSAYGKDAGRDACESTQATEDAARRGSYALTTWVEQIMS